MPVVMLHLVDHLTFNRMVNFCKLILQHVKEYCEQAAIHGPQHIVSERLSQLERLVTMYCEQKCFKKWPFRLSNQK